MLLCGYLNAQDSVYFYGANGRLVSENDEPLLKKSVRQTSENRYRVRHSSMTDEDWVRFKTERIRLHEDGLQKIRYWEDTWIPRKSERITEKTGTDLYSFEERKSGELTRTGNTRSLIPIHLEGRVVEYHSNGNIRSESEYEDNMLVSNRNYNPDGTEYIHNIFYTTDKPANYNYGDEFFRKFVMSRVERVDFPEINDRVVIGAVVLESGELSGVKVLEGSLASVNAFFKETVEALPGGWNPAILNGEPVRSFIQIPFNISKNLSSIRYLKLSNDGQIFWHD